MKSIILAVMLLFTGCAGQPQEINTVQNTYTQITQEQAKDMMSSDVVILDVRRQDEYAEGHIPNAICIPNESIGTEQPEALPDLNQTILIYCRSGNRSKQAAQKLASMGYTNVYEFGGIIDWTGDVVTGTAMLTFSSFNGGGPEYSVKIDDPSIITYSSSRQYHDRNHEELDGAGYDKIYTFTGLKPGETAITVSARSPIDENYDEVYRVTVDEGMNVKITQVSTMR